MFVLCPHKLCVVAAEIAFKNPFLRFGMKFFGGIEANRVTKDKSFVPKSVEEIKKGNLVQIFPEGHNTPDGKIHPFYKSYIAIPLDAKAPIIPIVTDGNYGMATIKVQIFSPLFIPYLTAFSLDNIDVKERIYIV
jgi:1-acyl-sn-glycerol-3-phosphate acyltransferase